MRIQTVIFGLMVMLAAMAPAQHAEAQVRGQQASGSRVMLDLPGSYTPAKQFAGFVDETAGVSFVILEMPVAAYEQLANGLTAEALASKGIMNAAAAKLERHEPYLYMLGEQTSGQGLVGKYLMAFRNEEITALITANVRKTSIDSGAISVGDIERIFASARIADTAAPTKNLFELDYLGPFKAAGTILGTSRAFTLDGRFEPSKPGERRALVIVAPSLNERILPDPDAQAETLFKGLPGVRDTTISERSHVSVSAAQSIEIVGAAFEQDGTGGVALYQLLVLPSKGGHYRIVGQIPVEAAAVLMPELRKIAQSFRIVE